MQIMRKGSIKLRDLITDVLPMSQWFAAFARVQSQQGLKMLLDPLR
jgi:threonine dehydrogenase-like Zn-dependent dehydrogenase